jgi:hypothetical protein
MYPAPAATTCTCARPSTRPPASWSAGSSFFAIFAGTIAALAAGFAEGSASRRASVSRACSGRGGRGTCSARCSTADLGVRVGARANNADFGCFKVRRCSPSWWAAAFGAGARRLRPLVGGRAPADFPGLRAGALAGAVQLPGLERLGLRGQRDPIAGRNVPRSLFLGLAICVVVYLLVNASTSTRSRWRAARRSRTLARRRPGAVRGGGGRAGRGLRAALDPGHPQRHGAGGPRIAYAMALDGLFLPAADRVHARFRTPTAGDRGPGGRWRSRSWPAAQLPERARLHDLFAIVLATSPTPRALRAAADREPDRPRPYRAWGYPWVPGSTCSETGRSPARW